MAHDLKWLGRQLFADGGDGGNGGEGATSTGESTSDAGEARLRELGVPEKVLEKRAKRANGRSNQTQTAQISKEQEHMQTPTAETSAPEGSQEDTNSAARMSWEDIMADPEYNKKMQETIQARLRSAK